MITQEFDLNMIPDSEPVIVHVNQADIGTGRLIAHLYHNDSPYSPSEASAIIQGTKPDKHGFGYDATISGNVVTADLTEQMTAVPGSVRTQIVVTDGYGVTGTFVFILEVQASALDADVDTSETEIPGIIDAARQSAIRAATSAAAALTSEQHAKTSEDNAKDSEDAAALSEQHAKTSEDNAKASEDNAADSEENAATSEFNAEAWAVGQRGGVDVPTTDPTYHNNSKYHAGQASASASNAHTSATNAATSESNSEAWAVGERGGEPVPSTDPTYHNSAEYWAEQAAASAARSGHTIRDNDGTPYTARTSLQFMDSVVADDETNNKTIVYPAILTTYMGISNDWFALLLDDDGSPILTDDDYGLLADWHYKYA